MSFSDQEFTTYNPFNQFNLKSQQLELESNLFLNEKTHSYEQIFLQGFENYFNELPDYLNENSCSKLYKQLSSENSSFDEVTTQDQSDNQSQQAQQTHQQVEEKEEIPETDYDFIIENYKISVQVYPELACHQINIRRFKRYDILKRRRL